MAKARSGNKKKKKSGAKTKTPKSVISSASNGVSVSIENGFFVQDTLLNALRTKYVLLGKAGWWWIFDDSLELIGKRLLENNFVALDDFLDGPDALKLHHEMKYVHDSGNMEDQSFVREEGALGGGSSGSNLSYKLKSVRGDYIAWLNTSSSNGDENLTQFRDYLKRIDTLVSELNRFVPELKSIGHRSNAMASCYPAEGTHYIKHCDNTSKIRNGRVLTVIIYLNPDYKVTDGGELKVFHAATETKGPKSETAPKCIIHPLLNRVILFFSDERVPHEVLPSNIIRYAITVWYMDGHQREEAKRLVANDAELKRKEEMKIKAEIEKFESKYKEQAVRIDRTLEAIDSDDEVVAPENPTDHENPSPVLVVSSPAEASSEADTVKVASIDSSKCVPEKNSTIPDLNNLNIKGEDSSMWDLD